MADWLEQVRAGYDADPEAEWRRLDWRVQNRIEYLITMHAIERHLPAPRGTVRVLDAGGGPGRYTIALAERGYRMTLLDLSPGNVAMARRRITEAGVTVAANVEAAVTGSFTDLSMFAEDTFDAVLCLGGAISHVIEPEQRLRALIELRRVARPGAPLLISAGNLLSLPRGVAQWPYLWQGTAAPTQDATAGLTAADLAYADRLTPASLACVPGARGRVSDLGNGAPYYDFMPEEFVALLETAGLELVRLYGCQGIAAHLPPANLEALMADPEWWPVWREWLLGTCDHPNLVGLSCHLIAVVSA